MQLGLLGPLQVQVSDGDLIIAGARLRALLCRLAVEPGRRVSTAELLDAVWQSDPPSDAANALQSLVSRLRRTLGEGAVLHQEVGGYRLAISPADLDVTVLTERLTEARRRRTAGDLDGAYDGLTSALELWRGEPLSDAGEADYAAGYRARWSALHRTVIRERVDLAQLRGDGASLVAELEALVSADPLDESLVGSLMRALTAAGRTAEALQSYERTRRLLADQLGTDPGRELQDLHLALLRGQVEPGPRGEPGRTRGRSNLRSWLTSFVGRGEDIERVLAFRPRQPADHRRRPWWGGQDPDCDRGGRSLVARQRPRQPGWSSWLR